MPSFSLLDGKDVSALIDYVVYLSVRGEVERRLMAAAIDQLGYEDTAPEEKWRLRLDANDEMPSVGLIRKILLDVVSQWHDADTQVVAVDPPKELSGPELVASIGRGKELFHGQIANCVGCHGPNGNGQVVTIDYDDWAKEYSTNLGITPTDRDAMRPFREAGALRPRQINPRNLRDGIFHGGGAPETIYRRIAVGVAGTPMPGVEVVKEDNGKGLTSDQVWDLVRYVQSLKEQRWAFGH
jgi:mono/diheme cytochrome c family protein